MTRALINPLRSKRLDLKSDMVYFPVAGELRLSGCRHSISFDGGCDRSSGVTGRYAFLIQISLQSTILGSKRPPIG